MQLIRNALDPHHLQRPHLIEMLWLSVADFRYAIRGRFDVLPVSMLPNYTQYKICVKLKVLAFNLTY